MHPANKWLAGTVSAALISAAGFLEGTRYYAYYDIVGVPTVCEGYTGTKNDPVVFGRKYSKAECDNYTRTILAGYGKKVLACVNNPMTEETYNAFTLMAYNVGPVGFCGSRAVKLFNQGLYKDACWAMAYGPDGKPVWAYAGGKLVNGLHKRRLYEARMCLGDGDAEYKPVALGGPGFSVAWDLDRAQSIS